MIEEIEGLPPLHRHALQAMHTAFELWIAGEEERFARQAATEVFRDIQRLEAKLSRFIENSEITAINRAAGSGEFVGVDLATMECLRAAVNVSRVTGGAFDITVGALMNCWKVDGKVREPSPEALRAAAALTGMEHLELDEENIAARLTLAGAQIDLGAIGKGYAVDCAARLLREWGVRSAVIHGGGSSIYCLGAPEGKDGWPLGVGHGAGESEEGRRVVLRDAALSASGTDFQGSHILDPRTGRPPVGGPIRAWALNPSATVADALSTAFMVMGEDEVEWVCGQFADVGAMLLVERDGQPALRRKGHWPQSE